MLRKAGEEHHRAGDHDPDVDDLDREDQWLQLLGDRLLCEFRNELTHGVDPP